jgi:hypothetical protein
LVGDVGALSHVASPARDPGRQRERRSAASTLFASSFVRRLEGGGLGLYHRALDDSAGIAGLGRRNVGEHVVQRIERFDHQYTRAPELVQMLREHRLQSPPGDDLIDVLIRRLQVP